jgi:hypothetical protein
MYAAPRWEWLALLVGGFSFVINEPGSYD